LKVELVSEGIQELLKSSEMAAVCKEHADAIRDRCGDGYTVDQYTGKNRVNAMVYAETAKAINDNYKNNTILKALK
jgi:hypothetical protein